MEMILNKPFLQKQIFREAMDEHDSVAHFIKVNFVLAVVYALYAPCAVGLWLYGQHFPHVFSSFTSNCLDSLVQVSVPCFATTTICLTGLCIFFKRFCYNQTEKELSAKVSNSLPLMCILPPLHLLVVAVMVIVLCASFYVGVFTLIILPGLLADLAPLLHLSVEAARGVGIMIVVVAVIMVMIWSMAQGGGYQDG